MVRWMPLEATTLASVPAGIVFTSTLSVGFTALLTVSEVKQNPLGYMSLVGLSPGDASWAKMGMLLREVSYDNPHSLLELIISTASVYW